LVPAAAWQLLQKEREHHLDVQNNHGLQPMQQSVKLAERKAGFIKAASKQGASGNSGQVMFTCQVQGLLTY
jgi:hypothetical protein